MHTCESCGGTYQVKLVKGAVTSKDSAHLCRICRNTVLAAALFRPGDYSQEWIEHLRVQAYAASLILVELERMGERERAAHYPYATGNADSCQEKDGE
jgi:hypothetical protein